MLATSLQLQCNVSREMIGANSTLIYIFQHHGWLKPI